MKTMYANIKKALKAILANYITAMEMYVEALNRSRGCACVEGFQSLHAAA